MKRIWEIDFFRGIAIVMMVVFHFLWDLKYFGFFEAGIYTGFWGLWQKATAGLFLFLAGISLTLSYNKNTSDYWKRFLKKGLLVFGAGLLITLFTWIAFPNEFIYFGILHLIGVSIILSIPLVDKKFVPLVLAPIFIFLHSLIQLPFLQHSFLVWLGFAMPFPALDFFPIFPWFGAVLLGIWAGNSLYPKAKRAFELWETKNWFVDFLGLLGKNSLLIYFLHQPILFSMVWLVSKAIEP